MLFRSVVLVIVAVACLVGCSQADYNPLGNAKGRADKLGTGPGNLERPTKTETGEKTEL